MLNSFINLNTYQKRNSYNILLDNCIIAWSELKAGYLIEPFLF